MSVLLHMYSEDRMRFEVEKENGCLWISTPRSTVSLMLSSQDRAKLRAALDRADAIEQQQVAA